MTALFLRGGVRGMGEAGNNGTAITLLEGGATGACGLYEPAPPWPQGKPGARCAAAAFRLS
jgi:hypothetical protein